MKFTNDLRNALAACQKLVVERRDLLARAASLEKRIADADAEREVALAALGDAEADGNTADIERARQRFRDADTALEGIGAGKRAITRRLIQLLADSREPLAALERESDSYRDAVLAELQGDVLRAVEELAPALRRALAVADGLGVPILPLAALAEVAGVTDRIRLNLDWHADSAATKARDAVTAPLAAIREIRQLELDARHRAEIERGPKGERPDFALVASERSFVVLKTFKVDGRDYVPGEKIARDAVHIDLLRRLYEQRSITSVASYEAGSAAA